MQTGEFRKEGGLNDRRSQKTASNIALGSISISDMALHKGAEPMPCSTDQDAAPGTQT
jgi:hypothetical protein